MIRTLPFKITLALGILLALLLAAPALSFGATTGSPDWQWVNPSVQGNTMKSLSFVDANTGWAAGIGGTVLKTTDGGATWNPKVPSISCGSVNGGGCNLSGISFVDANTGWVVGDFGTLWKTTNGGDNWTSQTAKLPSAYRSSDLTDVHFFNSNVGIAVATSVALITVDGGNNWNSVTTNLSGYFLTSVHMTSATSAIAVGNTGGIFKITISGATGSATRITAITPGSFGADLRSVYFSDANNGWATGGGYILRTTDGGNNWVRNTSAIAGVQLWGITSSGNNLVVCGNDGKILKRTSATNNSDAIDTVAAGLTEMTSDTTSQLLAVTYAGGSTNGYASGAAGAIVKTTDGGSIWQLKAGGNDKSFSGSSFVDANTGWMVAMDGSVLKTVNAGQNWASDSTGITAGTDLQAVQFLDANTGFAVGYFGGAGVAYKYVSGTWSAMTMPAGGGVNSLWGIHMTDATHGWAAGIPATLAVPATAAGVMLKTTNGTSWDYDPAAAGVIGNDVQLYGVESIGTNAWAVGQRGGTGAQCDPHIPLSCNGVGVLYHYNGSTWTEVQKSDTTFFTSVDMVSANIGYAVGYTWSPAAAGRGYKTTDGGATWTALTLGTAKLMADVSFLDGSVGFVAGEDGRVMKTVNGGASWTTQNLGTSVSMNTLSVVAESTTPSLIRDEVFVAGSNAAIIKGSCDGCADTASSTFLEHTLMGSYDLGGIFYIDHDTGRRRGIASENVFFNWGFAGGSVYWAPLSEINQYPQGDVLTPLAATRDGVMLVQSNSFRPIHDAATFEIFKMSWGLDWGDIKPLSDGAYASLNTGPPQPVITFPRLVDLLLRWPGLLHGQ